MTAATDVVCAAARRQGARAPRRSDSASRHKGDARPASTPTPKHPEDSSRIRTIEISGFGGKVVLPGTGGTIAVPYAALKTTFTLTCRFVFAPKAKDGTFAWPLTFSVQPNP